MATFHIPISCANTTGSTNFRVKYRLAGDSVWTSYLISPSSGTTTTTPQLLDNRIYQFQVQNINNTDNPISTTVQSIGITDVAILISPTSSTVGYSFPNLSQDITTYTVTLSETINPGVILGTHIIPAGVYPNTITDSFTGLTNVTEYTLTITIAAGVFTQVFTHIFTTTSTTACAAPTDVVATIN